MVVSERRPHNVNIRMSDEERDMLKAVADARGLSASDMVRQLVRDAFARLKRKRQ